MKKKRKKEKESPIRLSGLAIEFNVKNGNDRIYTEDSISPEIFKQLKSDVSLGTVFGELGQDFADREFDVNLGKISHRITDVSMSSKGITTEVEILDTTNGRIVKQLLEEGTRMGIASRSTGTIDSSGYVHIDNILTYDIVNNPAFENSHLKVVKSAKEEKRLGKLDDLIDGEDTI